MKRIAWCTAALAILIAAGVASAQAPPPPKPAEQEKPKPPAKKAKKVWTGEDLQDLKKPWDEHAEKKQAEEAAKAEAAKEPAKAEAKEPPAPEEIDPVTGKKILDPESLEAMERDLKGWEDEVKRTEQLAEDARKEMNSSPDQDAWESAKAKLEIYEQNVVDIQKKIEELRAQIAEKKKTQGKPPAKAPAPQAASTPPKS
jgi:hypothetical protein